jgi:sulfur-oxidizing protein SoxA
VKRSKAIKALVLAGGLTLGLLASHPGAATESDDQKFAAYRSMLEQDNPGQFWVDEGKALFYKKRGPKNASLEQCDFGLGPGVLKGAYAQMPRYFKDTGQVQTLEGRLLTCMEKLQGYTPKQIQEEVLKPHYTNADEENGTPDDLTRLTAFVAAQSNGMPFNPPLNTPQEKYVYALGKYTFFRRMGKMDLSCADCHNVPGRTIRGVELPVMTDPKTAGRVMAAFPAYVLKDSNVRTFWWRNERCLLAMRLPWLMTGSEIDAALTLFQAIEAKKSGHPIKVPGIKPRA